MTVVPTKNDNEFAVYPGSGANITLIDIPVELQPVLLQEIKEPVVLSAEEITSTEWPIKHGYISVGCFYTQQSLLNCTKKGDENGQLREYYSPEQVELRESAKYMLENALSALSDFAFVRLENALDRIKPPHDR